MIDYVCVCYTETMVLFLVKNGTRIWHQQTAVKGTYASDGIAVSTFAEKGCIVCIFSEIGVSKCPARTIMFNSGSMERLSICGNCN
jgi:hypothetical protein